MFYAYEHIRIDTNQIFYVGKGSGDRLNVTQNRNKHWNSVVKKAGGFFARKTIEDVDEEFIFLVESETIDILKKRGVKLTNLTSGGEGSANPSEETRQKMSECRLGSKNPRYNKNSFRQKRLRGELEPVDKELMKAKMKANHWSKTGSWSPPKGQKRSEEVKNKMRGIRESVAGGNNPKAKVIIYDVKEFSCIKDFAKFLNVNYKTLVVKIREVGRTVFTAEDFNSLTNGKVKFN